MDVVSITAARAMGGVRIVSRPGIPTPWAEAARGIFRVKGIPFVRAQETADDPKGAQVEWTGEAGAPVVAYEDEKLRTGWAEILHLAERIAPAPALIPASGSDRAHMLGLANEICGELGLGWCLRLMMVDRSLREPGASGAFPQKVARYLGAKYGYHPDTAADAPARVRSIVATLDQTLGDARYFIADRLSALDIYWAAFGNMFCLLSEEELPAVPMAREAWRAAGGALAGELPPRLRAHHRYVYETHLELPVKL